MDSILASGFVVPDYDGGSIANLPASIGSLLGVERGWVSPAVRELSGEWQTFDRVLLLLVDGVGKLRLQRELEVLASTIEESIGATPLIDTSLTSIAPATTSAATTAVLGNGAGPAESGMLGYTFLLPRQGMLANMLLFQPVGNGAGKPGDLESWGVVPEEFNPSPSIAQVLAEGGVESNAFLPARLTRTPLSRMQLRGAKVDGYMNWLDLWHKLGGWLGQVGSDRRFAYAYIPDFDASSHRDGTDVPLWSAMWERLAAELKEFIARAEPVSRTLFLITADHGHVDCPESARHFLQDHPWLSELCLLGPGGEARHANLYARAGAKEELLGRCRDELGHAFAVLDAAEALEAGLYGPIEKLHPETPTRLGDVLLLSRGPNHLWDRGSRGSMIGMHGSLEPEEALVPLLAFEL